MKPTIYLTLLLCAVLVVGCTQKAVVESGFEGIEAISLDFDIECASGSEIDLYHIQDENQFTSFLENLEEKDCRIVSDIPDINFDENDLVGMHHPLERCPYKFTNAKLIDIHGSHLFSIEVQETPAVCALKATGGSWHWLVAPNLEGELKSHSIRHIGMEPAVPEPDLILPDDDLIEYIDFEDNVLRAHMSCEKPLEDQVFVFDTQEEIENFLFNDVQSLGCDYAGNHIESINPPEIDFDSKTLVALYIPEEGCYFSYENEILRKGDVYIYEMDISKSTHGRSCTLRYEGGSWFFVEIPKMLDGETMGFEVIRTYKEE